MEKSEVNGGHVVATPGGWRMAVPTGREGYVNAQLDDYHARARNRPTFRWKPGTACRVRARFSAAAQTLVGTAGFGFWNAPFGPGTANRLRLPQAVWFFYASEASNLPLAPLDEKGNGWFVSTIDAWRLRALAWAPLLLPVLLLNQVRRIRNMLWPLVRRDLGISYERVKVDMRGWHDYRIDWHGDHTVFLIDEQPVLTTPMSPRGTLGFVAWMDNQTMTATPTGKLRWGTQQPSDEQWLEIEDLKIDD